MPSNGHRKTQTLLLIDRLLSLQAEISPLNVVIDSLEQSARPLLSEYIRQANAHKNNIIFVAYETLRPPPNITHFIRARRKAISDIQHEVASLLHKSPRSLIIIDSIHVLLAKDSGIISQLHSFTNPTSSLVVVHHEGTVQDVPSASATRYGPSPLIMLTYLATTIAYVHSFAQAKTKHDASLMSRAEPAFGLHEEKDGVIVGYGANSSTDIVVEMEHRRKSGRSVGLSFVLSSANQSHRSRSYEQNVTLRDEHQAFTISRGGPETEGSDPSNETFNLQLTDGQRKARAGVVLPYFDAQTGGGDGGRILYEMDREDDFDEEEDEI